MKRFLSTLLVITILLTGALCPVGAGAAVEGKTVDEFLGWITDNYPGYISSHTVEYKDRVLFAVGTYESGKPAMILGYSFKKSEVVEFALTTSFGNDNLTVYFLSSMSNASDAQARVDEATQHINSLTSNILQAVSNKWSKQTILGEYYLEIKQAQGNAGNLVFMWLNSGSKIKDKAAASTLINAENYPLSEVIVDLAAAPKEDASTTPVSGVVTLSAGEWLCPDHIPAGEYVVTPVDQAGIRVRRGSDPVASEYLVAKDGDEIGRLVLKSGDSIKINGGKLQFAPFKK